MPPSAPQPPYGSHPYGQPTQGQYGQPPPPPMGQPTQVYGQPPVPPSGQPTQVQPPYQQPGYGGQQQPYGQQPARGRATPPGQGAAQPPYPPYGSPGGEQPGHGYGGYPDPSGYGPPPKKKRTTLIAGLAVAAVIALAVCVGGVFWGASAFNNANLQAGQCVKREPAGDQDKAVKTDCSNSGAYEIVKRLDGTTDTGRCPKETTHTFVNSDDRYVLCLR